MWQEERKRRFLEDSTCSLWSWSSFLIWKGAIMSLLSISEPRDGVHRASFSYLVRQGFLLSLTTQSYKHGHRVLMRWPAPTEGEAHTGGCLDLQSQGLIVSKLGPARPYWVLVMKYQLCPSQASMACSEREAQFEKGLVIQSCRPDRNRLCSFCWGRPWLVTPSTSLEAGLLENHQQLGTEYESQELRGHISLHGKLRPMSNRLRSSYSYF